VNQMSQRWNHIRNQGNNKAPAAPCARRSSYRLARRSPYDAEGKNDGVSRTGIEHVSILEWFHGERLGSARLPPASSGFRVPNFEKRRAGGLEKSTPPAWRFCFCRRAVLIVFR